MLIRCRKNERLFLCALGSVLSTLSYFLFGWHVHEKAILPVLVLLGLLLPRSAEDAKIFWLASLSGTVGLFPLLFTLRDEITEFLLTASYLWISWSLLRAQFGAAWSAAFGRIDVAVIAGILGAVGFATCVCPIWFK